jgi:hypothetical protein
MKRRGPTHEDALQASRSVMKRALSQIAFFCKDAEASSIALAAFEEQQAVYKAGVLRIK